MKILHISASYKPAYIYGGPVMSVAKLCEEMESSDSSVSITVYTTLANGKEELPYTSGKEKIVDGIKVKYFKRITKDHIHFSPTLLWHLWKTVKQYNIIHIHAWWNLVTMPACFIAIFKGVKVILTPRGTLSSYSFEVNNSKLKGVFHQYFGKFLLNRTYFHCTSAKEVEDTKILLKPMGIFDLPNFVDLPRQRHFERFKSNGDDPLRLVFLSRIEQKKGLELLFEVLAKLDFNWELTIVGSGEKEYVQSLKWKVESGDLEQSINWFGAVYGDAKFELLAQHDYLILPSFDENFANVVIESLFVGTPVLISKQVGLSDYVSKNNLGFVCERTLAQIKEMIERAKKSKDNQLFDPVFIQETIIKDFDEKPLIQKYLKMYQEVIKN